MIYGLFIIFHLIKFVDSFYFFCAQLLLQKVGNSSCRLKDTGKPHAQSTLYQWILATSQDQAEPTLEK
jgi:hypothetical protein